MMEIGQAVAGSAPTVYRFLQREVDESAANYLVGQFAFGDLTLAESLRTVELFQTRSHAEDEQNYTSASELRAADNFTTKTRRAQSSKNIRIL